MELITVFVRRQSLVSDVNVLLCLQSYTDSWSMTCDLSLVNAGGGFGLVFKDRCNLMISVSLINFFLPFFTKASNVLISPLEKDGLGLP